MIYDVAFASRDWRFPCCDGRDYRGFLLRIYRKRLEGFTEHILARDSIHADFDQLSVCLSVRLFSQLKLTRARPLYGKLSDIFGESKDIQFAPFC